MIRLLPILILVPLLLIILLSGCHAPTAPDGLSPGAGTAEPAP